MITRKLKRFGSDTRGNVALIFAVAIVPAIGVGALAID